MTLDLKKEESIPEDLGIVIQPKQTALWKRTLERSEAELNNLKIQVELEEQLHNYIKQKVNMMESEQQTEEEQPQDEEADTA